MDRPLVPALTLADGYVVLKDAEHQPELCDFFCDPWWLTLNPALNV